MPKFTWIFFIVWLTTGCLTASFARAQDANGRDDFSFFVGHMLPNQIEGVTEILPVFGGRYAFAGSFGALEVGGQNSHAQGVDFTTLTVDVRGEIPVAQGISGLIYAGPVLNYYSQKNTSNRLTEYGLEVGVGAMMLVSDTLWLRGDLKFMGGPGTSLYLLFGLAFRTSAGQ